MALTPEQKQKLENLELMKEGVSFALKARAEETQTPTLVISLGGLGGTTLNELKRKVSHGLKQNGHVRFLAIDTDEEKDLAHIKKPVGNLDNGETMSIYSPSSATVLEHGVETAPAEMRKWLNPTFPNTVLSNDGAKGVRQIGRVMLANGETNSRVRNTLTAILTDMGIGTDSDSLNVILIAGISGGTGSGTIIDFTYILHDVLINTIRIPTGAYKIAAYLYTPDVQFSTKGIAGLEAIIQNLKKNGYAAFKEVDYFYNLNKHKASYKLDGYESTKDLFSTCTVVSASQGGGVGMRNQHDVIEALSELLLDQLTDVSYKDDNDSNVQMADSFMSNHDENVKAWYGTTFGAKTNFPKAAFFAYNTVGYASVHIPKDEILAYVAFKMFEAVNREWRNLENVDAEAVTDAMQNTGGTTLDSMVQYAKTVVLAGIEGHPEMEVQIPEGFIPESRFLRGTDCSTVILDAEDVGNEIIEKLKAIKFKEKLKSEIVRNIRSKVNDYFDENGPFATVDLLTHQIGDVPADKDNRNPFSGILQILALQSEAAKTQHNLSKLVKDDQTYLKDLENKRVRAESAVVDKKKYIMDYVETVEKYVQEYTVDAALYQIIGDVLDEARAELVDDNNKIWEVYTSVLREIGRIFKENNDIATEMKVHTTTTGKTFSYSVINLYEDNAKKDALQKYLDGFITPATTAEMCNDFVKSMRDHREAWTEMNVGGNFNAQEEVQRLFDDFFENKIGNDLIERFIVAAYQPNGGVSPAELDVIWDAGGSAKDAAISAAV
ncbi:MAG: hypothetical protein J6M27_05025, partial [Lachnospiraceae bacterium]|nr:hypothetical protein [Lachnospiraceae bacterium]